MEAPCTRDGEQNGDGGREHARPCAIAASAASPVQLHPLADTPSDRSSPTCRGGPRPGREGATPDTPLTSRRVEVMAKHARFHVRTRGIRRWFDASWVREACLNGKQGSKSRAQAHSASFARTRIRPVSQGYHGTRACRSVCTLAKNNLPSHCKLRTADFVIWPKRLENIETSRYRGL